MVIFRCKADCMQVHWEQTRKELWNSEMQFGEKKEKLSYRVNKTPSDRLFRLVSKIRGCDLLLA